MQEVKIDFTEFKKLFQLEFKKYIDEIVRYFYKKEFRMGIGGIIGNSLIFWFPKLWRKVSAGQLSVVFHSKLHSHWNEAVRHRVIFYKDYEIAPLTFIGFLLRVYRAKTYLFRLIRLGVFKKKDEDWMEYYLRMYRSRDWLPLVYTKEQFEAFTSGVEIETKGIFKMKDMIPSKKSYRLELYPPDITFRFPRGRKYQSDYSVGQVGFFHYTGTIGGNISCTTRNWLPLGEKIQISDRFSFIIKPKDDEIFMKEVFKPCLYDWSREIMRLATETAIEVYKKKPTDIMPDMKSRIIEVLKKHTKLSSGFIKKFAEAICKATTSQIQALFKELEKIGKLKTKPSEIIKIILRIREEYQ